MSGTTDLIVVGAGIVGLAHAYTAARRGLRVTVVERDHRCVGASIRNFGFITVSGQPAGDTWRRARISRDIWAELAPQAHIPIEHRGLWLLARRPRAAAVLQAFMDTDMAEGNVLYDAPEAAALAPMLRTDGATAAMYSPHELRVESRLAIPQLAAWLADRHGVRFLYGEAVLDIETPRVRTARRELLAERVVLCPGTELTGVGLPVLAPHRLKLTRLQMMRVRPEPGFVLNAAVMGDLSLVRYGGYAALPEAAALLRQRQDEEAASLAAGIHLIAVQSADGTLVVGDSHHIAASPEPYADEAVDALILRHLRETLDLAQCEVVSRWTGLYPTGAASDGVIEAPNAATRVVVVTSGTGASTAFAIAQEVLAGDPDTLAAVVFDWAGTVVDFGSQAPMGAFVDLFKSQGVAISIAEGRVPMGLPKWDHIQALGSLPRVAEAWSRAHRRAFDDADVDRLYALFTPMNIAALSQHAELIEGVPELMRTLRRRGLKIGSTTGYNREIMAVLAPLCAQQGFVPDNLVCAGDVPENRPSPLGMYRCFLDLAVWPARRVVKVDDTVPGLMEGRHADCWTVAVIVSGNEMGLTPAEWRALSRQHQSDRRQAAMARLNEARPDFCIDTVADLPEVLDEIEDRIASGGWPGE